MSALKLELIKYRQQYADCILLLFNSFKPEISYGVSREIVVKVLTDYFETDDREMTFDETNYVEDAREKANGVIASLKNCGWLEYEQETNHQLNIVLFEYAIPVIEGLNRILKEEEAEYQGINSGGVPERFDSHYLYQHLCRKPCKQLHHKAVG